MRAGLHGHHDAADQGRRYERIPTGGVQGAGGVLLRSGDGGGHRREDLPHRRAQRHKIGAVPVRRRARRAHRWNTGRIRRRPHLRRQGLRRLSRGDVLRHELRGRGGGHKVPHPGADHGQADYREADHGQADENAQQAAQCEANHVQPDQDPDRAADWAPDRAADRAADRQAHHPQAHHPQAHNGQARDLGSVGLDDDAHARFGCESDGLTLLAPGGGHGCPLERAVWG
mmetsp:Transcript_23463/g.53812  ORF Transcript_23463/g.53812 Transcript_23463/m.53812 type:complete len:229 (+) Transcript_23463:624-1310(+)